MNQLADFASVIEPRPYGTAVESKSRRREKNLTDALIIAFHSACDLKDCAVAWRLLQTLENSISLHKNDPGFDQRRALSVLVAGHERLWNLRHD